jgi:hypothetical protein
LKNKQAVTKIFEYLREYFKNIEILLASKNRWFLLMAKKTLKKDKLCRQRMWAPVNISRFADSKVGSFRLSLQIRSPLIFFRYRGVSMQIYESLQIVFRGTVYEIFRLGFFSQLLLALVDDLKRFRVFSKIIGILRIRSRLPGDENTGELIIISVNAFFSNTDHMMSGN